MTSRPPEQGRSEDFFARWSRRKRQAGKGLEEPSQEAGAAPPDPEPGERRLPRDEDMPPLESLRPESDYSGFLSPEVSEGLRRLALRKLFHSAGFNVRDGLDDYDQDFTQFTGLGDIVTAEMKHRLNLEARRLQERLAAAEREKGPASDAPGEPVAMAPDADAPPPEDTPDPGGPVTEDS